MEAGASIAGEREVKRKTRPSEDANEGFALLSTRSAGGLPYWRNTA
jgi:hypothetical protein